MKTNLGMYRVQLAGNEYAHDQEVGLHYQLHRGIGVHHQAALTAGKPFHVSITVGGSPAMTLAAVMPLPEGMSELTFAGALAGHRIPMIVGVDHAPIYADADFLIQGEVDPTRLKPEGPFGDHLGYYAKQHSFPFLRVKRVTHRAGAVWPFTVVGRPPQEDTTFGELIHELTGPVVPTVLPGVKAVHAVDAAGVHRCSSPSAANGTRLTIVLIVRKSCSLKPTQSSAKVKCRWLSICSSSTRTTTPSSRFKISPPFFNICWNASTGDGTYTFKHGPQSTLLITAAMGSIKARKSSWRLRGPSHASYRSNFLRIFRCQVSFRIPDVVFREFSRSKGQKSNRVRHPSRKLTSRLLV